MKAENKIIVVLLSVIALLLAWLAINSPWGQLASAQGGEGSQTSEVIALPVTVSQDTEYVFLIDSRSNRMAIYEYNFPKRKLRLLAVRNFTYDMKINQYNVDGLSVDDVRRMLEQHQNNLKKSGKKDAGKETTEDTDYPRTGP